MGKKITSEKVFQKLLKKYNGSYLALISEHNEYFKDKYLRLYSKQILTKIFPEKVIIKERNKIRFNSAQKKKKESKFLVKVKKRVFDTRRGVQTRFLDKSF